MIVTRQRRKPFPWKKLILPLIALALVAFALWWQPSRNVIANGPAGPVWRNVGNAFGGAAAPLHFAAQNKLLADRNKEIAQLQSRIADLQTKSQAKDKQIASLQTQVGQLQTQAANASSQKAAPAPAPTASAGAFGGGSAGSGSDLSAGATPDMRRTAQYWANMEPENAAKVVQKLPVVYVARVFAQMSPDSASAIMDALPPAYVAALTQEHPELKR